MSERRKVSVEIGGVTVNLITSTDQSQLDKVVGMVDESCERVIAATKTPLTHKTSLLVAMNIAERYIELQTRFEAIKARADKSTRKALDALERAIPAAPKNGAK